MECSQRSRKGAIYSWNLADQIEKIWHLVGLGGYEVSDMQRSTNPLAKNLAQDSHEKEEQFWLKGFLPFFLEKVTIKLH